MRSPLVTLLVYFLSDGTQQPELDQIQKQKQQQQQQQRQRLVPKPPPTRPLTPPFPDGLNQGRIITIPPEETYSVDVHLSGNNLVLPPRPIDVWLPHEYDEPQFQSIQFPVLFCHDGQDALLDTTSWTGQSWRLLGALTRLSERKLLHQSPNHVPPIVVSLRSADSDLIPGVRRRHLEYGEINTAITNPQQLFAQAHVEFVAKTIVPYIHNHFRASTETDHNFVMGASMGAQASMNLLLQYPDLFGGAACLSPYFGQSTIQTVSQNYSKLRNKRIYMDIGGDIDKVKVSWFDVMDHLTPDNWWNPGYWWLDTQLQPAVDAMSRELKTANIPHQYHKIPGGRHNERAWSERIHLPLKYLFGNENTSKT